MGLEIEQSWHTYGLMQEKTVVNILLDQSPTVHDQKNLIVLTGCEIVKVKTNNIYRAIKETSRQLFSGERSNVKNARDGVWEVFNAPVYSAEIDITFSENVTLVSSDIRKGLVLEYPHGGVALFPPKTRSSDISFLANFFEASLVGYDFEVVTTLQKVAYHHRSSIK